MNVRRSIPLSLFACFALGACSSDSEPEPPGRWSGSKPHFAMHGLLNGENIAISLTDDSLADGMPVWCERTYSTPVVDGAADLTQAEQTELTIAGTVMVAGEERNFELELMGHALQEDDPGTKVTIIPRDDAVEPEPDEMWLEIEWSTPEGEDLLEAAAQEGTFTLGQFTGTPGTGGVVIPEGEGSIGGFAQARWSVSDSLRIDFTVLCTENDVEEEF
jgi:hypothetical protein